MLLLARQHILLLFYGMKINSAFLIMSVCALLAACGGTQQPADKPTGDTANVAKTGANFDKNYTGLLGADSILMKLQAKERIISGSYFIKGKADEVFLSGAMYATDSIRLEGLDGANQTTTQFLGTIIGTTFSGQWGNKPFNLTETTAEYVAANYVVIDTVKYKLATKEKKNKVAKCNAKVVYPLIENPNNKPALAKIIADVEKNFLPALKDCDGYEAYDGQTLDYENEAIGSIILNDGVILGVELAGYNTGGAHPNGWTNTYYYDVETGSRIKLVDMFQGPNLKKLATLTQDKLKKKFKVKTLSAAGFFDNTINLKGDENFYVNRKNDSLFTLYFNPYEIGPYVMGDVEVEFKYSEVLPMLSNRTAFSKIIK